MRVNGVPRAKGRSAVWSAEPALPRETRRVCSGKKDDAELADDEFELIVAEGQVQRIGLLP
jgi:hypothetical protein